MKELTWAGVDGLIAEGGAMLGTSRAVPSPDEAVGLCAALEREGVDALVIVGGLNGLFAAERLAAAGAGIPIACLPATIDNNVPGSEFAVGADSALNGAVMVLDRVKQSASASIRCFVAETMGRRCGYLTLMAAIATGAERVYLHEDGITLEQLEHDVERMHEAFRSGRRLFLAVRNEHADERYTTDVLAELFAAEADGLHDVRTAVVGHMQQGGEPSPFDRLLAVRLATASIDHVCSGSAGGEPVVAAVDDGQVCVRTLSDALGQLDYENERPRDQWWMPLRPLVEQLSIAPAAGDEAWHS
jgi:6-phosphofructokinase 1